MLATSGSRSSIPREQRGMWPSPTRVAKDHQYREELLAEVLDTCAHGWTLRQHMQARLSKEKTIEEHHGAEKPDTTALIAKHVSQFGKKVQVQ